MTQELGPVKFTVTLDTQEARRQIAELKAGLGKPAPSAQGQQLTPTAAVESNAEAKRKKVLDQIRRELQAARALKHAGLRSPTPEPTDQRSILSELGKAAEKRASRMALASPVAGTAQGLAASKLIPTGVAKGVGVAALIYGAIRLGTEERVLMMELLKQALPPALTNNVVFRQLQSFFEGLARRFDALESSVIGGVKAMATTGEYAISSARIAGEAPGILSVADQLKDDFVVETQKERLDYAFGRFRRKQLAGAIGESLNEMITGWNR